MSRLPFNPKDMDAVRNPPAPPAPPASSTHRPAPLSVSQLAALIDRALRDHTPVTLKVVGEIGQFRERAHWYFDIKDAGAVVSCVMWQSAARKLGFTPKTGQQVVISGRVEFYPPQGRTQFLADKIEPVGVGALDLALKQLIEEARALGWLDEYRKRPLPALPRKVAVITSRSGAALQDVIDTVRRRCPSLQLALVDVRVQGEGAAQQVAAAVRSLSARHAELGVDVILITRGGGSMEDLWAFNERVVAEAIVNCPVPVICAIGHETDTTLAELVADVRAATPTQAAMRIAPDASALREQLDSLGARLASILARHIRAEEDRLRALTRHARLIARESISARRRTLDDFAVRLERVRPESVFARRSAALDVLSARLNAAVLAKSTAVDLQDLADRLTRSIKLSAHVRLTAVEGAARNLDLVGPLGVLKRGYSVTLAPDGSVVRSATSVREGDVVRTRLADGSFASIVTSESRTDRDDALPAVPAAGRQALSRTPFRRKLKRRDDDHPGLFTS